MLRHSRRGRLILSGWIVLTALAVLFGRAEAEIGFRRVTPLDRILDPVRFPPGLGYSSVPWDTTAPPDSLAADSLAIPPDSLAALPTDTLAVESVVVDSTPADAKASPSDSLDWREDDFPAEGVEAKPEDEKSEPPPYRPTNISYVALPIETKSAIDTSTGLISLTPHWSGANLGASGAIPLEEFLARQTMLADRESRRMSVLAKFPTNAKKEGEGINIQIPVFKSKRAQRIFGGSNIGLNVTGNIQIDGSIATEKKDAYQAGSGNPTNYAFKINQKQQFNIKGKVGEKVTVEIDQDSEKLFEFENSLRVRYKGEEDEIVQSVEAGNVDLSLRGSKLATASSQHKGLFGFKTESKLGGWKLTTIASLDKGEKNLQKWTGGSRSDNPIRIDPRNFTQNRYYFLDTLYRENYRYYDKDYNHVIRQGLPEILEIEVYKSVNLNAGNTDNAITGYAFADPNEVIEPGRSIPSDDEHIHGAWVRLEPEQEYKVDKNLGYIRLVRTLSSEALAVAYNTRDGSQYGDLNPRNVTGREAIFKLLQPPNPKPTQRHTWPLMWRNVYELGSTGISEEGFELQIYKTEGQAGSVGRDTGPDKSGNTYPFIEIFHLDQFSIGGRGKDGKVDPRWIDLQNGEVRFPDLTPFNPTGFYEINLENGSAALIDPRLASTDAIPELYTQTPRDNDRLTTPLYIGVKYSSASSTIDLGWGLLEGSEEVTLDGRRLTRDVDYRIDYNSGSLSILNKSALAPGADLEIRYEKGQVFQLDTQTKLGMRLEYELWENSYVGGTFLYLNQRTMEQRVRVGGEPKRNTVWSLNGALNYEPEFFTRMIDWLPLIETDAKSQFRIEGEIAQVFPDPNPLDNPSTGDNEGVAYIDDFESIKRSTPLGVSRRQWSDASFPVRDSRGSGRWLRQRGRTLWSNPDQVKVTEIWPERQTEAQSSTIQILKVEYQPWWGEWESGLPGNLDPEKSWGGIMRYLGPGYSDQSQSKYLEIWLDRGAASQGAIYFDLGRISEDVIPNFRLNTEDHPRPGYQTGDGAVDALEDVGIDSMRGVDPHDSTFVNGLDLPKLPSYDDWNRGDDRNYKQINGTERNGTVTPADEGGRIPDTEDLSGNGFLDQANDFFRYRIDLNEGDLNRYIVGGQGNRHGWRLYRIPLTDTLEVGKPAFTDFDYVRIWFTGLRRKATFRIAQMDIVGNEWRETKESATDPADAVSVAVINTHDNPTYAHLQPPGVSGEIDPVSGLREKEQSIIVRVNRLETGGTGSIYKTIKPSMNLLEYKLMKMFVRGGGESGRLVDRYGKPLDLEMFIRLGSEFGKDNITARSRYYEYSQRLAPGWDKSNEIAIELDRLAALKFLREVDSTRDYDILPDGDVIRVVGAASLRDVSFIQIGLKNHGAEITPQDGVEIWLDELRVSDIHRNSGWAAAGSVSLKFAEFIDLRTSLTQYQADFHSLDSRRGADPADKLSGDLTAGIEIGELFDPTLGIKIPIDFRFKQDVTIPKYKPNSDVLLSSLSAEKIDLWSKFNEAILTADRFRRPPSEESAADSLVSTDKTYSVTTNLSKGKKSEFWPVRYTLDNLRFGGSYQETWGRDFSYLLEYRKSKSANANYTLAPEKPPAFRWLGWATNWPVLKYIAESEFRPLPSSVTLSGTGTEATSSVLRRTGSKNESYQFTTGRTGGMGWRPFEITSFDFSYTVNSLRVPEDTLRSKIAARLTRLDSTGYWMDTDSGKFFDRSRWAADSLTELGEIKDGLFWKGVGYYFIDTDISQNVNTSFRPEFVSWLGTDFTYRTTYRWTWGQNLGPTDRSVRARGDFNSTFTLRLPQLTSGWRSGGGQEIPPPTGAPDDFFGKDEPDPRAKPPGMRAGSGSGGKGSGSGSGAGKEERTPGEEAPAEDAPPPWMEGVDGTPKLPDLPAPMDSLAKDTTFVEGEKKPVRLPGVSPLQLGKSVLSRVRDVQWSYSLTGDAANYTVAEGQAEWAYRLGFSRDPGLETIPGYGNRDVFSRREEHKIGSGYDITKNLSISSVEMTFSQSRNIGQQESGTRSQTVFQYFQEDTTIKSVPAANFNIRWSGWEALPYVRDWATSITLENSFRGSTTEQWQRVSPDSAKKTTGIEYEKNFSPLLGISFTWKGGIGTTARYNWTSRVTDQRAGLGSKQRTTNGSFSLQGSYTSRSGFSVPVPVWPFKNRRFKNNTTFSLSFTSSNSSTESAPIGSPFSETSKTKQWSLTPSMDYSFSTAVRGGFRYAYSVQKSKLNSSRSQEFGFTVNISIRG